MSEGSSGLTSIRIRALRPLPIAAAHGVGAGRKAFYVFFFVVVRLCARVRVCVCEVALAAVAQ